MKGEPPLVEKEWGLWSPWSVGASTMVDSWLFFNPKPSLAKGGLGMFVGQAKGGKGHVLASHGLAQKQAVSACGAVCVCCVCVVYGCCWQEGWGAWLPPAP